LESCRLSLFFFVLNATWEHDPRPADNGEPIVKSLFYEDVVAWLDQNDIRYTSKVKFHWGKWLRSPVRLHHSKVSEGAGAHTAGNQSSEARQRRSLPLCLGGYAAGIVLGSLLHQSRRVTRNLS
jgi:hypothetical protein